MEVLREGYRIPFLRRPPLSEVPIPMPSYNPLSTKGFALGEVTQALIAKGAVGIAPLPSPGFYNRLFLVWKTSGSWRPVIDLSTLNLFVDVSHFRMETIQSVLLSVRQGDWMASIDLKEAYLQVPVHLESRPFLRFVANGQVYQFTALCFGLSTAPQVFSRVMAPVSAILHFWDIRMRRYLNNWLVQSSSRESLLQDLHVVLDLCRELGIVINLEKSNLVHSQVVQYLGVVIDAQSFVASPSPDRIARLRSTAGEFLSSADPPASIWLSLLAVLAVPSRSGWSAPHAVAPAVSPPVLGSGGSVNPDPLVSGLPPGSEVVAALAPPLSGGVSPSSVSRPGLLVRCLGRRLGGSLGSSHRFRPLGPRGKSAFHQRKGTSGCAQRSPPLPVISSGEDSLCLLRKQHSRCLPPQGGRHEVSFSEFSGSGDSPLVGVPLRSPGSPVHPGVSECSSGHSVPPSPAASYRVVPQSGGLSVFMSSVAGANRLVCYLRESPMLDLFLSLPGSSSGGHRRVPSVLGRSSGLRVSLWSIIPRVLAKLRGSRGTELTLVAPYWPQRTWFPDLLHLSLAPPVALPVRQDLLRLPRSRNLYQGLHRLHLHAWRDSGASCVRPDSLPQ